jgi:hypothetical protein
MYELPLIASPRAASFVLLDDDALLADPIIRGPGWQLFGEDSTWLVRIAPKLVNPAASYADARRRIGQLARRVGPRPLVVDLAHAPRLAGSGVRELIARLFCDLERRGLPFAVIVGHDLVQAVRVHGLLVHTAPTTGRCVTTLADARRWLVAAQPS